MSKVPGRYMQLLVIDTLTVYYIKTILCS